MSESSISLVLTPFEEQTMQAIGSYVSNYLDPYATDVSFVGICIHVTGRSMYGPSWGGACVDSPHGASQAPLINRTLGALKIKGLVYRIDDEYSRAAGLTAGEWFVTPLGCDLLGLPSSSVGG